MVAMSQVRESIETQGTTARWEFNPTLLFDRSGHMAGVCADLAGMLVTLRDMRQFLGPELKAVTGGVKHLLLTEHCRLTNTKYLLTDLECPKTI